MIKINLLPKSINEKKIVRNIAILFGVIVVAIIAVGILYTNMCMVPKVQQMESDATHAEELERQVNSIESERDGWKAKIPPIQQKVDFIKNVLEYNQQFPKLYEDIAKWTYEKISYTSMSSTGQDVTMTAQARSLDDLGRFLLNIYRATDLFTEVAISGVPGYPVESNSDSGQDAGNSSWGGGGPEGNTQGIGAIATGVQQGPKARYINFSVTCKLRTPITAPSFGGVGAPATGMPGDPAAMTPAAPPPAAGAPVQ